MSTAEEVYSEFNQFCIILQLKCGWITLNKTTKQSPASPHQSTESRQNQAGAQIEAFIRLENIAQGPGLA